MIRVHEDFEDLKSVLSTIETLGIKPLLVQFTIRAVTVQAIIQYGFVNNGLDSQRLDY